MSTKIQINSLAALERLIGGDSELEIEVRNSVIQAFAKNHLKALITDELLKNAKMAVLAEIQKEFFDIVKEQYGGLKPVFKPEIYEQLKASLLNQADRELRGIVNEALETKKKLTEVDYKIKSACDFIDGELSERVLNNKLDRMVTDRIKQKFNIE